MPESIVSLLITVKPTAQENFRSAAILLRVIFTCYKNIALTEVEYFLILYYYALFQALNVSGSNIALISPLHNCSTLLLTKQLTAVMENRGPSKLCVGYARVLEHI
jgi:hypothetical protein